MSLPIAICATIALGFAMVQTWTLPHYFFARHCTLYILLTQSARQLWHFRIRVGTLGSHFFAQFPCWRWP